MGALDGVGGSKELVVTEGDKQFLLKESGDGGFYEIPIKDVDAYISQRNPHSSDDFITKNFTDAREHHQAQRRQQAFKKQLHKMVDDMIEPTGTVGHRFVTWKDEKVLDAQAAYAKAAASGKGRYFNFQPLITYRHLVEKVRPIYKGEVGLLCEGGDAAMREGKPFWIVILEKGYGTGNFTSVGVKIG